MSKFYGEKVTPVLVEIEETLWEIDGRDEQEPYDYPPEALRAAAKIFMSVCMDKLWDNQEYRELPMKKHG